MLGGWLTPNASPVPRAPKYPGACLGRVGEGALPQSQPLSSLQAPPPRAPLQSYELILHEGTHKVLQRGLGGDLPYRVRYMGIYLTVETHSGVVVSWDRKTSVIIRLRHEYKVGGGRLRDPREGAELSLLDQARQCGLAADGLLRAGGGQAQAQFPRGRVSPGGRRSWLPGPCAQPLHAHWAKALWVKQAPGHLASCPLQDPLGSPPS